MASPDDFSDDTDEGYHNDSEISFDKIQIDVVASSAETVSDDGRDQLVYDDGESDNEVDLESSKSNSVQELENEVNETPIRAVGRGRKSKPPVDDFGRPLGKASIVDAKPPPGFYWQPHRTARPSLKYQMAHALPGETFSRRSRSADKSKLNYKIKNGQLEIIIDQDDREGLAFEYASRICAKNGIQIGKPKYELWHFGLIKYSIATEKPLKLNLLQLFYEGIDDINRPFWFSFKKDFSFDPQVNLSDEYVQLTNRVGANLTFGALCSMHKFWFHQDFFYPKKSNWSFFFTEQFFDLCFRMTSFDKTTRQAMKKYRISKDLIDRVVNFSLWPDSFELFVNIKGNILEYIKNPLDDFFVRCSLKPNEKVRPLFTTIRFGFTLRNEILETRVNEQEKSGIDQLNELLQRFIKFFKENRIQICFSPMRSKKVFLESFDQYEHVLFSTFLKNYAWQMLWKMNFRTQIKIYSSSRFRTGLNEFDKHDEKSFYRLFLFLYRRSLEKFFLEFDAEIEVGCSMLEERLSSRKFDENQISTSVAKIPSVIITPTSIIFRPLKLCKLNRVLREKKFGGPLNFALVELRDEANKMLSAPAYRALRPLIEKYLTQGFSLNQQFNYKYLHHSQSQVKSKQFWFYHHEESGQYLSHEDSYIWMGNFDKERVVAKHTARIALCFTSTEATIRIPAEIVTYVRDIKDSTGEYTFSDGVGTISTNLRNQVKAFLKKKYDFSVLQIRYGGCKGTLSVDPRLDHQQKQMRLTDSMNKFISDHDNLEICKLSAPRPLYLNRQAIVLLESRDIEDSKFLYLQNQYHLALIKALMNIEDAFLILQEKMLPVFRLRNIALNFDIINEQFFKKLTVTCAFNIIGELINRTRIYLDSETGRNMFGIVDEYGVLEYGQIFAQYTPIRKGTLYRTADEDDNRENIDTRPPICLRGKVVVTKNPCHHPGDLRVFDAVYHKKLAHLKDVIVFPQKGPRPHPNEISGSDLDGDEYVVIWHKDLIPTTPNEEAYNYDSQGDPPKMDHPIRRDEIIKLVMEVSEQDCLGSLSNIHLAYVDRDGIKSELCKQLAGYISQEVDAAKTGRHPLTEDQIREYSKDFGSSWPDFMKSSSRKETYPSKRVLGKLYRSAHRAVSGWKRMIQSYGSERHIRTVEELTGETSEEIKLESISIFDNDLQHPQWEKYQKDIKVLFNAYEDELLEIVKVYRFHDEIDLFARCESMDGGLSTKKNPNDDSAATEVQTLVDKIRRNFHDDLAKQMNCQRCKSREYRETLCEQCFENRLIKASCAYVFAYKKSENLPANSNRRILSFPWLFETYLIKLKERKSNVTDRSATEEIFGRAIVDFAKSIQFKFQISFAECSRKQESLDVFYFDHNIKSRKFGKKNQPSTIPISVLFERYLFAEVFNYWLEKQNIFQATMVETERKPKIPHELWKELVVNFLLSQNKQNVQIVFKTEVLENDEEEKVLKRLLSRTDFNFRNFQSFFDELDRILTEKINSTRSNQWAYLQEYIYLALQSIAIDKRLQERWIA